LLRHQIEELQQLDLANFSYADISEQHSKLANLGPDLKHRPSSG